MRRFLPIKKTFIGAITVIFIMMTLRLLIDHNII